MLFHWGSVLDSLSRVYVFGVGNNMYMCVTDKA